MVVSIISVGEWSMSMSNVAQSFPKRFGVALLFAWVLILAGATVFLGGIGAVVKAQSLESATTDGGIYYLGTVGFMVGPPEGWGNLPETAAALGVCFMFVPEGYDFDSAPAVMYANLNNAVNDVEGDDDLVEALAQNMLQKMRRLPGGEKVQLLHGESFVSARKLDFQQCYFNNGPPPNSFELVTYHVQGEVMLIAVLSAMTEQARQDYLADFMRMLDDVLAIQVSLADDIAANNNP